MVVAALPWSWLVDGSNGRPPVSLGSDMFDEGGDGRYISKAEAMGLADIGGSSGGVGKGSQKTQKWLCGRWLWASGHVLDVSAKFPRTMTGNGEWEG